MQFDEKSLDQGFMLVDIWAKSEANLEAKNAHHTPLAC